jgi:hypothetical protein
MAVPSKSHSSIVISTYAALHPHLEAFVQGTYRLLMLLGSPGLGKTEALAHTIGNRPCSRLDSRVTPLALFQELYAARDGMMMVIDDVDGLLNDPLSRSLLKSACDTSERRRVSWHSTSSLIGNGPWQTPASFETSSRICLIANTWSSLHPDAQAIRDRAMEFNFKPTPHEVHVKANEWFDCPEVYDFLENHLSLIVQPSFRHYVKGEQLRQAVPDCWRDQLLEIVGIDDQIRTVIRLLDDPGFTSEEARVEAFREAGHGSRATYFRIKKQVLETRDPSFRLANYRQAG